MSDDVKKVGVQPVVHPDQGAIESRDRDAPATDEAPIDGYSLLAQEISPPPGPASAIHAARLRELMKSADNKIRFLATSDYRDLLPNLKDNLPELRAGAERLRASILHSGQLNNIFDERLIVAGYGDLVRNFKEGSAEVYAEAAALREIMRWTEGEEVLANALSAYAHLVPKFADSSPEVYKGAETVIEILVGVGSRNVRTLRVVQSAAEVYGLLARKFRADGPIASQANSFLSRYPAEPFLREAFGQVFKETFHHLSSIGFFKAAFESGAWIAQYGIMGFSEKAVRNLRGFANQPGFIGFRESIMTVLDSFRELTPDKMMVLNRVFEATDPGKWKSVRNTLSTLRAMAALDSLPARLCNGFYRFRRDVAGDPRALLRAGVEKTLIDFLYAVIGGKGALELLFMDEARKSGDSLKLWRHVQAVRNFLSSKGLLSLFAQSASFMNGDGRRILKNLLGELATSPIVDGELRYQKRYDRMVERLGFSAEFVDLWSREWKNVRELRSGAIDAGEARALVMKQAAEQLAVHVNSTPGKDGEFKELPDRLRVLTGKLRHGEADVEEIGRLHETLELKYQAVREAYGDLFANSRIDLKNLRTGLMKGVRLAKRSEATEISGRVDRLAFHGMIPTETCQRLSSLYAESTNGSGQPLNKLLWGQFKLANHIMDGEIMARRMLEVTRDEEGREHLLVERAYTAGGFAGLAEFDEDIVEHARGIGIERDRVHFLDRHEERPVPAPLATGAQMYRDSGLAEVNPAFTNPFRPMIPATASMPMMSAGMMLRTGT
ncbi:MAG: hypothetical protein WC683_00800 [bacterium]